METPAIHQKVKALRKRRNITIQDLSRKTGLTPGYLSKIENSPKPPPIPTLTKIAYALNVHISYFFEDNAEPVSGPSIVRASDRKEIMGDYTSLGYRYEAVIKNKAARSIKPLIITLPDAVDPAAIPYNFHDGEEMIYVLSGNMLFFYGDENYNVKEGDCLHFQATVPHKVVSAESSRGVKILSILMF